MNVRLLIAPRSGYLFEWHGCLGLYDRNFGAVEAVGERLKLTFTFENDREGFQGIAPEFIPVLWGERHYLVPADDVIGFCNEVNTGAEPRAGVHGQYLLRRGDEMRKAEGWPGLPAEYLGALLQRPVQATVVGIGAVTLRPSVCEWFFEDTSLTIDAGRRAGLRAGMRLYVIEPTGLVEWIDLTQVEEFRSDGIHTRCTDPSGPALARGWRVSTHAPWRPFSVDPTQSPR